MIIILSLLVAVMSAFSIDVEVGDGNRTIHAIPVMGLFGYSWSNYIVPASYIGTDIEISEIKFDVSNSPDNYTNSDQKIYMKHTTETIVLQDYPNPEQNGFTLVYEGDVTWDGGGWQGVVLDTQFDYDGRSNLQVVWENRTGLWAAGFPVFLATDVAPNISAFNASDASFPETAGNSELCFPNMILSSEVEGEPEVVTLVAPENLSTDNPITVELEWEINANTTEVDVYFSDIRNEVSGLNELAKVIDGQNVTTHQVTNLDPYTIYYWRVVSRNSANALEAVSPTWQFTTGNNGQLTTVTVGDGNILTNEIPYNYFWFFSLSETIYLAEEINAAGQIHGITYDTSFDFNVVNANTKVWIGETNQTDVANYIRPSQLNLVFSGDISIPSGEGQAHINFDTPYDYSGGNLVILSGRPLSDVYYSNTEKFYCTSTNVSNRSVFWYSDNVSHDPENMPASNLYTDLMPNITFNFDTSEMGSIAGNVTDGSAPLSGVNLTIEGTINHAVSEADGSFEFPYVSEDENYSLIATYHGYDDLTTSVDVVAGEETLVSLTMTPRETVSVTGQLIANDTNSGLQGNFFITGYDTQEVATDANGNFTLSNVYANASYNGSATANGFNPSFIDVEVGSTNLDLGTIILNEILFPVSEVTATLEGQNAMVTWSTPVDVAGLESFSDGFEGDLSNWDEIILGPGTGGDPTNVSHWHIGAPDAGYDGNCLRVDWGYNIDTWAITPSIAVNENSSINFEFNTSYEWFVAPYDNAQFSVKVSADGTNWTEVWNEEDYGFFENFAWLDINIPLTDYAGQAVQVAFHVYGGDNANLHMDNVYIGNTRTNSNRVVATPNSTIDNLAKSYSNVSYTIAHNQKALFAQNQSNSSRSFLSYNLYRFLVEDQEDSSDWVLVADALTDTTHTETLFTQSLQYRVC